MSAGNEVLKALVILSSYEKDLGLVPEHDEIWIGHDIPPGRLAANDRKRLEELGFIWDEGIPAWHKFL